MRWFKHMTFDVLGDLAFDKSFGCLQRSAYHWWISLIFTNIKFYGALISTRFYPAVDSMLAMLIPASLARAQKAHAQLIVDKVPRRLESTSQRLDFMSTIQANIQASSADSLAIAGSETTALSLAASLNLLIHNVDKMELLVGEIRERFRAYDEITIQTVWDLEYLNAFLNEVLRLYPPIPWLAPWRAPEGGATVCGMWLPGGNLAWAEMTVDLAKVLWSFDVSEPKDEKKWVVWESLRVLMLIEKKPIVVVIRPRAN
ncbi:cytochrome P450 [Lasiosphaeria ovina]|uniref:Cytochrome P450 n=1 Tax=Lasiosphaeria ovina TaxID=92902 RepID=A0AAE0NIL9_9PEZI|nr:cytochrome P450 [Lasiosphaeria ovina]